MKKLLVCIFSLCFVAYNQQIVSAKEDSASTNHSLSTASYIEEQNLNQFVSSPLRPSKIWVEIERAFSGRAPATIYIHEYPSHGGIYRGTLS